MNILITGAGGFLARHLFSYYKSHNDVNCVGLARHKLAGEQNDSILCVDVLDYDSIEKSLVGMEFDAVIHLAALTAHSDIVDNKYESLDINLRGTENILRWFNKHCKNSLFIYASTGKIYGSTNESPISESAFVNPINILGKSKFIAERIVDFYAEQDNKYLVTRIFNVYGFDQKNNFVVPTIVNQLKHGREIVLGNISDKRDYLYIDDVISALAACIEHKDKLAHVDFLNIGSGIPLSVADIITAFEKCLNVEISVRIDSSRFRQDETVVEYCNNSKIKKLTGWWPRFDINTGIDIVCRNSGLK